MTAPVVYLFDQDSDFVRVVEFVLNKMGITTQAFMDRKDLLTSLVRRPPLLCLIEIAALTKFEQDSEANIITEIKRAGYPNLPIMVTAPTSLENNLNLIASALEQGAVDFLFKPLNREVFLAKLMQYVYSDSLKESVEQIPASRKSTQRIIAGAEFDITRIFETGLQLHSAHLFTKGTPIGVRSSLLSELSGRSRPILMTPTKNWVESNPVGNRIYGAELEFNLEDTDLLRSVRRWLLLNG